MSTCFIHEDRLNRVEILPVTYGKLFPGVQRPWRPNPDKTFGYPSFDRLKRELANRGFAFFELVNTGYAAHEEGLKHTCAFELDRAYFFCQFSNNDVKKLFADDIRPRYAHQIPGELIETLLWLGKDFGLCLNDHDLEESFDLTDRHAIQAYITET